MKKIIFLILGVSLALSPLSASVYKGHSLFKKKCLDCHGKAMEFVIAKTTQEWSDVLADNGEPLYLMHKGNDQALIYFDGNRYRKNVRHLRDFFFEYAADTGSIPACD